MKENHLKKVYQSLYTTDITMARIDIRNGPSVSREYRDLNLRRILALMFFPRNREDG